MNTMRCLFVKGAVIMLSMISSLTLTQACFGQQMTTVDSVVNQQIQGQESCNVDEIKADGNTNPTGFVITKPANK